MAGSRAWRVAVEWMWLWVQPHDVLYIYMYVLAFAGISAINCCSYGVSTGEDLVGRYFHQTAKDHMTSLVTYMYMYRCSNPKDTYSRNPTCSCEEKLKPPISDRRY